MGAASLWRHTALLFALGPGVYGRGSAGGYERCPGRRALLAGMAADDLCDAQWAQWLCRRNRGGLEHAAGGDNAAFLYALEGELGKMRDLLGALAGRLLGSFSGGIRTALRGLFRSVVLRSCLSHLPKWHKKYGFSTASHAGKP